MSSPQGMFFVLPSEVAENLISLDQSFRIEEPIRVRSSEAQADDLFNGARVKFKPEYADHPSKIFTVSQWDGQKGWISDKQGRGWYFRAYQVDLMDESDDLINDEYDKDEVFPN